MKVTHVEISRCCCYSAARKLGGNLMVMRLLRLKLVLRHVGERSETLHTWLISGRAGRASSEADQPAVCR